MSDYSKLSIFNGLSESDISQILQTSKAGSLSFKDGEFIVCDGQSVVNIGIIVTGSAQVEKNDWNGNRSILFELQADSMFGEALFCTGAKVFHLTITAKENCTVLFLDGNALFNNESIPNRDVIFFNLMKIMARKNLLFREKIDILSKRSTREKLLQYLSTQSCNKESDVFDISLDRQGLADYLCVERSALSSVIGKLEDDGLIKSRKNHFELLPVAKLHKSSDSDYLP